MSIHQCPSCKCVGEPVSLKRWHRYQPHEDKRDGAAKGNCSDCKDVLQRGDINVTCEWGGPTKRYYCEPCALNAGWDGQFTSTVADEVLLAQSRMQTGEITVEEYIKIVDRVGT